MPVYPGPSRDRWLVRIYHRGKPLTWRVNGTKRDAEALEARLRLDLDVAGEQPRTVPTFSAFCVATYRPHAELRLRASWWSKQSYILATLIERLGGTSLRDFDAAVLETYARQRLRDKLRPVSVNNELRVLLRVLRFARDDCEMSIRVPKWEALDEGGHSRVTAWTHGELDRLLATTAEKHPAILPLVVCGANTGMRKGEILAVLWENVDLGRRQIRVWPSEEWRPKNGKPREVPISDALLPWFQCDRRSRWAFPTRKGERYAYWPQRQFDECRTAAGLKGGPHQLRHTFATHFLEHTPDMFLLARILGHSDAAVTRLYAHLLPEHLATAQNVVSVEAPIGPAAVEAKRRWKT